MIPRLGDGNYGKALLNKYIYNRLEIDSPSRGRKLILPSFPLTNSLQSLEIDSPSRGRKPAPRLEIDSPSRGRKLIYIISATYHAIKFRN